MLNIPKEGEFVVWCVCPDIGHKEMVVCESQESAERCIRVMQYYESFVQLKHSHEYYILSKETSVC